VARLQTINQLHRETAANELLLQEQIRTLQVGFYRVLLGLIGFYRVLLGLIGFYRVLLGLAVRV